MRPFNLTAEAGGKKAKASGQVHSWETINTGLNDVVSQLAACAQLTQDALLLTGAN